MVIWITGKQGAGKSTYAKRIKKILEKLGDKVLILDGDDIRNELNNHSFDDNSRFQHIMNIAAHAKIAEKQGFTVIVSLISPKKEWRMKARKLFDESLLIYIPGGSLWKGTEYEEPDHEEIIISGN